MNVYWILAFVFLSSFVYGLIGFADALILIPIASPIIGMQTAVIFVTIWGIVPNTLNLIHYRKYIDKRYVKRALLTGIPGTAIGTLLLLLSMELRWIELLLGCFILLFSSIQLYKVSKENKKLNDVENLPENVETKDLSESVLLIGGFTYGLFGGLIGASGPINVALLEGTGHYREDFIGNFAAVGFPMNILKIAMYIWTFIKFDSLPVDLLPIFALGLPIIFVASKLGHKLTPKIPVKKFRIIVLVFLVIIGIRAIFMQTLFYN